MRNYNLMDLVWASIYRNEKMEKKEFEAGEI